MKSSDKRVTAELLIVTIEAAIARGVGTTARAVNCWRRRSLYSNACSGRASSPSRSRRIDGGRVFRAWDGHRLALCRVVSDRFFKALISRRGLARPKRFERLSPIVVV